MVGSRDRRIHRSALRSWIFKLCCWLGWLLGGLGSVTGSASAEVIWETGHQVRVLTHNEGLPSSYGIEVGPDGFVWIGTLGGLFRFDGRNLEAIHDAEGRPFGTINTLAFYTGPDGAERVLWLGTLDGLVVLDLKSSQEARIPYDASKPLGLTHPRITSLLLEDGSAWVGTQHGLNRVGPDLEITGRWGRDVGEPKPGRLLGRDVSSSFRDHQGRLFVATDYGLYEFRTEDKSFELIPAAHWQDLDPYRPDALAGQPDRFVNGVVEDHAGRILVATFAGFFQLDEASRTLVPEPTLAATCPRWNGARIEWASKSPRGDVLVAGTQGIARLQVDGTVTCYGALDFPGPQSEVVEDEAGNVWTIDNSTEVRWLPAGQDRPSRARPFEDGRALSVDRFLPGKNGELWSLQGRTVVRLHWGAEIRPLQSFDLDRILFRDFESPPRLVTFAPDGEGFWLSYFGGLGHVNASTGKTTRFRYENAMSDRVRGRRLYSPAPGDVWSIHVGAMDFCRVETGTCESYGWSEAKDLWALSMVKDSKGRMWAGAGAGGFYQLDQDARKWKPFRYDEDARRDGSETRISSMVEDERGYLWLGTHHNGLLELDEERRLVRRYDRLSPLGSDDARKVALDDDGLVWIYASRGLTRLDPRASEMARYDSTSGVPVTGWARTIGVSGDMLLLSQGDEIFRFPTVGVTAEDRVPRVYFDRLRIGGVPILPRPGDTEAHLQRPLRFSRHVTFGPEDRLISFDLASPYFTKTRTQRLRYRLDDYDEQWIELSPESRVVSYTRLPAGTYRLRVQASNGDGLWGDEESVLGIRVEPPWWKSMWALVVYMLAVAFAITGVYRLQRLQLARKQEKLDYERLVNRRLRELDRMKDDFLANTSHELRTPLFGIAGLAEGLSLQKGVPERVKRDLSLIMSSARRLTSLVNDVLDFSKLQRRELSIDAKAVSVRQAVDGVLVLSKPLVGHKKLRLINDVDRDLPPVRADEGRFDQILHNLIGNAIKFTPSGSVKISAETSGRHMVITVEDTGPGIAPGDRERIFRSFEQGGDSTGHVPGTGLGLSVSFRLAELQGGSLWLEPHSQEGAVFRFSLPIWEEERATDKASDDPGMPQSVDSSPGDPGEDRSGSWTPVDPITADPVIAVDANPGTSDPVTSEMELADLQPMRILLVDDEPVNLRVLMSYLSSPQFELLTAPDGPTALSVLQDQATKKESIDLILLDIMMPGMSGYEVCQAVRRNHSLEELPILLLTAKTGARDRVAGFDAGANDYLVKPVERSELIARVKKELRLLKQHRKLTQDIHNLSDLLPICASCKRVRQDGGFWEQVEDFLGRQTEAQISHAVCPDCMQDLYGDMPKN